MAKSLVLDKLYNNPYKIFASHSTRDRIKYSMFVEKGLEPLQKLGVPSKLSLWFAQLIKI